MTKPKHAKVKKYKVRSSELAPIIIDFIQKHNGEHPQRVGGNGQGQVQHTPVLQGWDYLSRRSGIGRGRIQSIIEVDREYWDFAVADKLLCAMDRPDLFHTEIEILDA